MLWCKVSSGTCHGLAEGLTIARPAMQVVAGSGRWQQEQTHHGRPAGHAVEADGASACVLNVQTASQSSCDHAATARSSRCRRMTVQRPGVDAGVILPRSTVENSPADRAAQGAPWGPAANHHPILLCPDEMERSGDQAWGRCDDVRPSSTGAVNLGDCPRVGTGRRFAERSPAAGASGVWAAHRLRD